MARPISRAPGSPPTAAASGRSRRLAREIVGFPRHLSQHVGGFVITRSRLDEVMPIGNAAMDERTFVEWDKDDLDALGILKIDVLGLGMLSCLRKALDLVEKHYPEACPAPTLSCPAQAGHPVNTNGETGRTGLPACAGNDSRRLTLTCYPRRRSRRLPHARPRRFARRVPGGEPRADDHAAAAETHNFYDLVIEVAIVRPGPIQGDMVHPYLRRRQRAGAGHLSRRRSWKRCCRKPWACRCSRSRP